MDELVDGTFTKLDESDPLDVIYIIDNGYHMGNHTLPAHTAEIYPYAHCGWCPHSWAS